MKLPKPSDESLGYYRLTLRDSYWSLDILERRPVGRLPHNLSSCRSRPTGRLSNSAASRRP
ncbi:MAG TPA: hypothetical protein VGL91_19840, partial [Acidobacteriota bacterium]